MEDRKNPESKKMDEGGKELWSKYRDLLWIILIIVGFITNAVLNYSIKTSAIEQNSKRTLENKVDIAEINKRLNGVERLLARQEAVNKKIDETYESVERLRDYLMKEKK